MTATFGKLEHETLTLQPGLNILEAPNEWGKSTWSAFLIAMLYGLDTRAKTTKNALADKERFAPWSGAPMAGRIDLCWQGRDITVERFTKRRIPLGEFRAYETKTGLSVPELTADNCGRQLLGVEQSVFRRAGFIRHSDLPVTQDEALRRRLNALVTTGDDSGEADRLAQNLKELKNRCRYNRSGLLPQAEAERDALDGRLQELENLSLQSRKLRQRLEELKQWRARLENHRAALDYAASRADAQKVAQARDARDRGLRELTRLEHAAASLPDPETARREADKLRAHIAQWNDLQLELQLQPRTPERPEEDPVFRGMTGDEALAQARKDAGEYEALRRSAPARPWLLLAAAAVAVGIAVLFFAPPLWALLPAAAALVCTGGAVLRGNNRLTRLRFFEERYGSADPGGWITAARKHGASLAAYREQTEACRSSRAELEDRLAALGQQRRELSRGETPEKALYLWEQAQRSWEEYRNALRDQQKLEEHLQTLQSMARSAAEPAFRDNLTYTGEQTLTLLRDAAAEQQRLQQRLGQYQGQMEALGDPEELKKRRAAIEERIARLEEYYAALTVAQETLLEARLELQRRFAPRIAKRAGQLMERMTDGRYNRLTLGADFSLQAGTRWEDTLHDAWWRSDGTTDQLYLALRIAVAEALTPEAPLILDDALVRFDETRLKAVMKILKEEAEDKQVILFTCQSREKQAAQGIDNA